MVEIYYKLSTETEYIKYMGKELVIPAESGKTYDYYAVGRNLAGAIATLDSTSIALKTYNPACPSYGDWPTSPTETLTKQSTCTEIAKDSAEANGDTSYVTCTLDSDWTNLGSSDVSSCSNSESTTSKVSCSGAKYKSCSTSSSRISTGSCTKGSAPSCGASSKSYVSKCENKTYAATCCADAKCTGTKTKTGSGSCPSNPCGSYGNKGCKVIEYYKTTTTLSAGTRYYTKTSYAKYYTKKTYTKPLTYVPCWE